MNGAQYALLGYALGLGLFVIFALTTFIGHRRLDRREARRTDS